MKRKLTLLVLALFSLTLLTACGSQFSAVKDLASSEQKRQSLDENSIYSSVAVTAQQPATIVYTWTYKDQINEKSTSARLMDNSYKSTVQAMLDNSVFPQMLAKKINNPNVEYVYKAKEGKTIASLKFTPSAGVRAATSG